MTDSSFPFDELTKRRAPSLPPLALPEFEPRPASSRTSRVLRSGLLLTLAFALSTYGLARSGHYDAYVGKTLLAGLFGAASLHFASPGESRRIRPGLRAALPFVFLVLAATSLALVADHYSMNEFTAPHTHTGCLPHSLVTTALVWVSLLLAWRGTDPFAPRALGAFFGALAGILGAFSVTLTCASDEGYHLLLGHGAAGLTFAVLGALFGRKLLAP